MKKIMNKATEIINDFDSIEEISIWKSKNGTFYLMVYLPEDKQTKIAKAKLFKYNNEKEQFEFSKERDY